MGGGISVVRNSNKSCLESIFKGIEICDFFLVGEEELSGFFFCVRMICIILFSKLKGFEVYVRT